MIHGNSSHLSTRANAATWRMTVGVFLPFIGRSFLITSDVILPELCPLFREYIWKLERMCGLIEVSIRVRTLSHSPRTSTPHSRSPSLLGSAKPTYSEFSI